MSEPLPIFALPNLLFNIKNIKKTMKKMWVVAAIVCAALMVSCGGKKNEKKDAKGGVEAKAKEFVNKMYAAEKAGDEAAAAKLQAELEAYATTLSEADLEAFEAAIMNAVEAVEAKEAKEVAQGEEDAPVIEVESAPVAANPEVTAKANEFADKYIAAIKANDMAAIEKLDTEAQAWLMNLSEADQALAAEVVSAAMAAAGL